MLIVFLINECFNKFEREKKKIVITIPTYKLFIVNICNSKCCVVRLCLWWFNYTCLHDLLNHNTLANNMWCIDINNFICSICTCLRSLITVTQYSIILAIRDVHVLICIHFSYFITIQCNFNFCLIFYITCHCIRQHRYDS